MAPFCLRRFKKSLHLLLQFVTRARAERSGRDPGPRRRESRLSRRQERGRAFPQVFYSARFGIAASPHSPPNIPSQHAICYMAERESGWAQRKAPRFQRAAAPCRGPPCCRLLLAEGPDRCERAPQPLKTGPRQPMMYTNSYTRTARGGDSLKELSTNLLLG